MARIMGFQPVNITAFNKSTGIERETSSGCLLLAMQTIFQPKLAPKKLCRHCASGRSHFQNVVTLFAQIALGRKLEVLMSQFHVGAHSSLPKTLFSYIYQEMPILVNLASFVSLVIDERELNRIPAVTHFFGPIITSRPDGQETFDREFSFFLFFKVSI